jgi:hypothetical protein
MPDVSDFDNEQDWMAACVPTRIEEGDEQKQAVAVCFSMWREREKSALEFDMLLTKAETMADGRVRWQARANTGEWDLERERFDISFWDDILHNFSRVQEATTKGETLDMPVPILDIAHYSFRLPADKRNMARAGYPIKLWRDGRALMAQGYFDNTPLGRAAAKAAQQRAVEDRRVSVGVWPDWGRVELDDEGRRIYRGGRGRAYLDHLAMTSAPVDPGTILEVKSMGQKQDALDVLGAEAEELVNELEAATEKSMPEGVVVKAEEPEPEVIEEPEAKAEAEKPSEKKDAGERSITLSELQTLIKQLFESFKSNLDERLGPVEAAVGEIAEMKAQIDALGATETEKVKSAIDSGGGDWWQELLKASVQRQQPVENAGPEQKRAAPPDDPFYRMFGGLANTGG